MLIFRLEGIDRKDQCTDKVHAGFYRSAEDWQISAFTNGNYATDRRLHPLPEDDSGLSKAWCRLTAEDAINWYFGFSSFAQFKRWFFDDGALSLCEHNIVLRVYECECVLEGYTQAIFDTRKDVVLLAEFKPATPTDVVHKTLQTKGINYV